MDRNVWNYRIVEWIKNGDLEALQNVCNNLTQRDDLPSLFKTAFVNACIFGKIEIAKWLYSLYEVAPLLMRSGLRPVFHYCHHVAVKKGDRELAIWLEGLIKN